MAGHGAAPPTARLAAGPSVHPPSDMGSRAPSTATLWKRRRKLAGRAGFPAVLRLLIAVTGKNSAATNLAEPGANAILSARPKTDPRGKHGTYEPSSGFLSAADRADSARSVDGAQVRGDAASRATQREPSRRVADRRLTSRAGVPHSPSGTHHSKTLRSYTKPKREQGFFVLRTWGRNVRGEGDSPIFLPDHPMDGARRKIGTVPAVLSPAAKSLARALVLVAMPRMRLFHCHPLELFDARPCS